MTARPPYVRASDADWDAVRSYLEEWAADRGHDYDGHLCGVLDTVRWLADQPIRFDGRDRLPYPPVCEESYYRARPETVQEEYGAALVELAHGRHERDDYLRGVIYTLRWAWLGTGLPPVLVTRLAS